MKKVFLTFDDGPGPKSLEIAKLLEKFGVKATFFFTGKNIERFPFEARSINELGHRIGNHSYSHRKLSTLSYNEIIEEIEKTDQLIQKTCQKKSDLFRAPFGEFTPEIRLILRQLKLHYVDWSFFSKDTDYSKLSRKLDPDWIIQEIKGGDVVLFHDGATDEDQNEEDIRGSNLIEVLPTMIIQLKKKGFIFDCIKSNIQWDFRIKYFIRLSFKHLGIMGSGKFLNEYKNQKIKIILERL